MDFDFHCMPEHILEGRPVAIFKFIGLVIVVVIAFYILRRLFKSLLFRAVIIVLGALLIYGGITSPEARAHMSTLASEMWASATEQYDDFKD